MELDGDRDRPLTGSVAGEKVNGTAGEGDAVPLTRSEESSIRRKLELLVDL